MFDWFLSILKLDRRNDAQPVPMERRRLSRKMADERLCSSIDRFSTAVGDLRAKREQR